MTAGFGLVFVVFLLVKIVIIVVGVWRRHRIDQADGDWALVDQPKSGGVFGDAHVGSS
jgi:hypothetical protein